MWIVLGAVVVVVVAVVAIVAMRRPRADDLHSVQSYHSALGTLETFSDRIGHSPPEVVGQPDRSSEGHVRPRFYSRATADATAPEGSPVDPVEARRAGGRAIAPHPSIPPVPVHGNPELPDPGSPLVFEDAHPPIDHQPRDAAGLPAPGLRMDRAQRHALDSMNHRPRRITTVLIVVAALVLFGVLAFVGSRRSGSTKPGHAVATATTTGRSTTSHTSVRNRRGGGSTRRKVTPTTTTVPKQIVALTSTPTSATFPVGESAYKVTVATSGPCWVQAITVETGSTLWEGTLQAGQVQVIPANGPVTVELGAPAATLRIDNIPVVLPVPLHTPFVARFQPSTTTPAGSGATTTVPSTTSNGSASPTTTRPTAAGGPGA